MRFGMFMAPFHTTVQDPTSALERDLQHIELLDRLGFDEVWIGEHHSAGAELVTSPEVFIAMAAARTSRIRLGTGVISLPYHNPLWVADRAILLDHLTRGRFMLGVGPGSLPTDAAMIGLEPAVLRPRLDEGVSAILHLLTSDEPLTKKTDWFVLENAVTQLRPFSVPRFEVAVPGVASPTGARLAGKYGISLLSIGAAAAQGIDVFAQHWDVVEAMAAQHGHKTDRSKWRVVSMVHLAETEAQARKDVEFGIVDWFRYFQRVAAFPQMAMPGESVDEMADFVNDNGLGVVGTPDMLVELLRSWYAQSGGFGVCLIMHHDWANDAATRRSHELVARFVMPEVQGHADRLRSRRDAAIASRQNMVDQASAAVQAATDSYVKEVTT